MEKHTAQNRMSAYNFTNHWLFEVIVKYFSVPCCPVVMKGDLDTYFLQILIWPCICTFDIFLAKTKENVGAQHFL